MTSINHCRNLGAILGAIFVPFCPHLSISQTTKASKNGNLDTANIEFSLVRQEGLEPTALARRPTPLSKIRVTKLCPKDHTIEKLKSQTQMTIINHYTYLCTAYLKFEILSLESYLVSFVSYVAHVVHASVKDGNVRV